jgi:hypothetical protein
VRAINASNKQYSDGNIDYLVRIPPGWTPSQSKDTGLPVIYLHGLGFGLVSPTPGPADDQVTSFALIKSLIKSLPDQPLLIPLQPHTSQSIFHPRHLRPWTRAEFVESLSRTCTKFGFWTPPTNGAEVQGGCSILSHSNGSVPHAWSMLILSGENELMAVLKDIPSLALRDTFVDPIVFCIWEGDMTHSVCYRKPTTVRPYHQVTVLIIGNGTTHVIPDSKRNWNCSLYPSCKSHRGAWLMSSISTGRRIRCFSMRSQQVGIIQRQLSS